MRELLTCVLLAATAAAQQGSPSIGEVQGADAKVRGAVTLGPAGTTTVMSGSQVTAGAGPATIKLTRGGELKVCSGGSVTITSSVSGKEALVGLSAGAIETHYHLSSSADTVMTPDFRLQLPGPGDFHFAIGMKSSGDMCVKSLPGNSSAMIVNEVFGEGTHQVRPGEAVVFQKGSVQNPLTLSPGETGAAGEECGCPGAQAARPTELGFPEQQSQSAAAAIAAGESPLQTTPLPGVSSNKNEVITKVDAPIVFRGEDLRSGAVPGKEVPPAAKSGAAAPAAPVVTQPVPKVEAKGVPEPVAPEKPVKKKWYQRLGSALGRLFH